MRTTNVVTSNIETAPTTTSSADERRSTRSWNIVVDSVFYDSRQRQISQHNSCTVHVTDTRGYRICFGMRINVE